MLTLGCAGGLGPRDESEARKIADLSSRLSWDSIRYDEGAHIELSSRVEGDVARELLKIGRPATQDLLRALEDPIRGTAAHIVLCDIWEPGVRGGSSEEAIREGDKVVGFWLSYRGLRWTWKLGEGYSADPGELSENLRRWKKRLGVK